MKNSASTERDAVKQRLQEQLAPLQAELHRIEDAEKKAESVAFLGKCFKYRNNYSCPKGPQDYWWLYAKVIGMGEYWPVAFEFQTDKDGQITIREKECFSRLKGHNEITQKEFDAAWRKVQQAVAKRKP